MNKDIVNIESTSIVLNYEFKRFNILHSPTSKSLNLKLLESNFDKSFELIFVFNGSNIDQVMPYHYIRLFLSYLSTRSHIQGRFNNEAIRNTFLNAFKRSKMLIWLFQELYLIFEPRHFISFFSDEKFSVLKGLYKEIIELVSILTSEVNVLIIFNNYDKSSEFTKEFFEQLVCSNNAFTFFASSSCSMQSEYVDVKNIDFYQLFSNFNDKFVASKFSFLDKEQSEAIIKSSPELMFNITLDNFTRAIVEQYLADEYFSGKSLIDYYYCSYFLNDRCLNILNLLLIFQEPITVKTFNHFFDDFQSRYFNDFLSLVDAGLISCFGNVNDLNSLCFFSDFSVEFYLKLFNEKNQISLDKLCNQFIQNLLTKDLDITVQLSYFLFRSFVKYDIDISKQQFEVALDHLNFLISVFVNIKHNDYDRFVSTLETFYLKYEDISLSKKLLFIDFNIQFHLTNDNFQQVEDYIFIRQKLVPNQQLNNVYFQIKYLEKQHQYKEIVDLAMGELKRNKITIFSTSILGLINFISIYLKINLFFKQKDKIVSSQLDYNYELIHKTLISLALSSIWQLFNSFEDHVKQKSFFHKLLFMKNYSFILNQASLKLLYISLRKGYSEGSVFGYNVYWLHYCSVFKFKKAFEMGRKLLPFFSTQNSEIANFSLLLYYFWISPIKFSYDFSIIQISKIRSLSEKYSRNFTEGVSVIFLMFLKINTGVNLRLVLSDFEKFRNDSLNQAYYREISLECLNLLESATTNEFNCNEYRYLTNNHQKNIIFATPILFETLMLFINNKYDIIISNESKLLSIFSPVFNVHFYYLILFILLNSKFLSKKKSYFSKHLKKFDLLLDLHDLNFHPKYFITKGNQLAAQKQYEKSLTYFDKAITLATKSNNYLDLALASEFRAIVLEKLNLTEYMRFDYYKSLTYYEQFGLLWKSNQIKEKQNVMLLNFLYDIKSTDVNKLLTDTFSKIYLDFSNQKEFNELVRSILIFCSEFTAKNSFSLFFMNEGRLVFNSSIDQDEIIFSNNIDDKKIKDKYPFHTLLRYALNGERLMLKKPHLVEEFSDENYFIKKKPNYVSLFPIKTKDKFLGIIYSESPSFEFFTTTQLDFLDNFFSIASIAIQNLQLSEQNQALISNLEERVSEQVSQIQIAEEEKRKSLEIAQKASAQSAYAVLTRGIAHEIRNPMAMILSGTELTIDNIDDTEKVLKYMNIVKDSVLRLKSISTNMLRYGNPVSNSKKYIDILTLLSVVKDVSMAECKKRQIKIDLISANVKQVFVDENSIYQVFINLILNAIQAIEKKGNITLSVIEKSYYDKSYHYHDGICVLIKDTGKGISKDKIKQIFDPFYSSKYGNVGLGLSIVFNTLDLHHGKIEVESTENVGTTFSVYLPFDKVIK